MLDYREQLRLYCEKYGWTSNGIKDEAKKRGRSIDSRNVYRCIWGGKDRKPTGHLGKHLNLVLDIIGAKLMVFPKDVYIKDGQLKDKDGSFVRAKLETAEDIEKYCDDKGAGIQDIVDLCIDIKNDADSPPMVKKWAAETLLGLQGKSIKTMEKQVRDAGDKQPESEDNEAGIVPAEVLRIISKGISGS